MAAPGKNAAPDYIVRLIDIRKTYITGDLKVPVL